MFSAEQLQECLTSAFSERGYIFQIVQQAPLAEIYLNYAHSEQAPIAETIGKEIEAAIAQKLGSNWGEITEVYLVGRQLGHTDPEWDIQLNFASSQRTEETAISAASHTAEAEEHSPLPLEEISEAAQKAEQPNDDNRKQEAETLAETSSQDIAPDKPETSDPSQAEFDLHDYCFIRNKQLITSEILPPPEELAQLIAEFDELSDPDKRHLLPQLQDFFTGKGQAGATTDTQQTWINALENLPQNYRRKASIWLSRYCANPTETIEKITNVLNPPAPPTEPEPTHSTDEITNPQPTASNRPAAHRPETHRPAHQASQVSQRHSHLHSEEPIEESKSPRVNLLIPVIVFIITLFLVGMDVRGRYNVEQYANLCTDSSASADTCLVSGQLLGTGAFKEAAKEGKKVDNQSDAIFDADLISNYVKDASIIESEDYGISAVSLKLCLGQAYGNAGFTAPELVSRDFDGIDLASDRTLLERVLPGIFSYRVTVPAKNNGVDVTTLCVLQGQPQEMTYVMGDRLPSDWPDVPYETEKNTLNFLLANIELNPLSAISLSTFFSGIGLFVVVVLGWAIRINTMQTFYLTAFVLGFTQYVLSLLKIYGIFSLFATPALLSLVLGIAAIPIKGLDIEWSSGYRLVASSVVAIALIQRLLSTLLLFFLFQLLA